MTHQNLHNLVTLLKSYNNEDLKHEGKYQIRFDIDTFDYQNEVEYAVIIRFEKLLPSVLLMPLTSFVTRENVEWFIGTNTLHIQ